MRMWCGCVCFMLGSIICEWSGRVKREIDGRERERKRIMYACVLEYST